MSKRYDRIISKQKTKVTAFKAVQPIKLKISIDNQQAEQATSTMILIVI